MMIKKFFGVTTFISIHLIGLAQSNQLTSPNISILKKMELELKEPARTIIQSENPEIRLKSDSIFTRQLVKALQIPHSFFYHFDSLETISILMSPDSLFRIFTWQLEIDENNYRQHGAIQMRTEDGSLKLFPLIDRSDRIEKQEDTVTNHKAWLGAIYYKIIPKQFNGKSTYTLIGFDAGNIRSSRKIIEVLTFKDGEPVFGGPFFFIANSSTKPKSQARFIMEYKKNASPRLNYDPGFDLIVKEHLSSDNGNPLQTWTLVGDGDYEAFKWSGNKWVYQEYLFEKVTPNKQAPTPMLKTEDNKSN
jgi:hypothetical protein